jgi:hypothetical protein
LANWRRPRPAKPAFVQFLVATTGCLVLIALYLGAMRATVDLSRVDLGKSQETRDSIYLAIHGGGVLVAAIAGFVIGKLLSGRGFAYASLFTMVMVAAMTAAQLGSFALACEGENDLIRHWTC